jgi:hypothetical protein
MTGCTLGLLCVEEAVDDADDPGVEGDASTSDATAGDMLAATVAMVVGAVVAGTAPVDAAAAVGGN